MVEMDEVMVRGMDELLSKILRRVSEGIEVPAEVALEAMSSSVEVS